ncbi:peptidoglycan DD-metalloendopeptidase family protein [Winogradskyella immobilis]|uniref:Peptidoglycan DD-metalloendopeptidase family protein n=1 Tax=Winogradskyella immobilis TaxID=2816852 RepID=A0ABS8ER01_9FLAO|nr:peptidoglycan DD-metalloendopeptidase family protein [Winogradskyella immobilis]MCC1485436.1 peptidoglycan DD-metalloendopeptidase family protein [Winogradskyella immobilis]MCG0017528.1 peptidoglycan DD-metalloendopeptidase family protein [Winogradskyella immobilis]
MTIESFSNFLKSISDKPLSVLDPSIPLKDFCALDLSVSNKQLQNVDVSSSDALEKHIWNHINESNAKVAYGGYLEQRGIYNRSAYFNQENPETERNIHLGIDLWIKANTPIYAPLDGTIHSFNNNTNYGDYGPTIILKHNINGIVFHTLYGHLSEISLLGKQVGTEVKQGEQIATLGTAEVNGDYAPHLHFQLVKDMQDFKGDYPGVTNRLDLDFYKINCPDPNLLLKLY